MPDDAPHTPPIESPGFQPTCWKCGYVLSGLRVEGSCPECNTLIWGPRVGLTDAETDRIVTQVLVWGIASLCLTFVCLGPLAALLTIPAFVNHRRFQVLYKSGAATPSQAGSVKAGIICARISVWVSVVLVVLYASMLLGGTFF